MDTRLILIFVSLCASHVVGEVEYASKVTDANFQQTLDENEFVLIEFYTVECSICHRLGREYAERNEKLSEKLTIKLVALDMSENKKTAEKYVEGGRPTLLFFRKDFEPVRFNKIAKGEELINWLKEKVGDPVETLNSVKDVESFLPEDQVAFVGFFDDLNSKAAKDFKKLAYSVDDIPFGITSNTLVFENYKAKDGSIMLFKPFDERKIFYEGIMEKKELEAFGRLHSVPLIIDMSDENEDMIGRVPRTQFLIFYTLAKPDYSQQIDALRPVAEQYRSEFVFISINVDLIAYKKAIEFFDFNPENTPLMRIIKSDHIPLKYKPEKDEFTPDNLKVFLDKFLAGELSPYQVSAKLPKNWDKDTVKILVGTNFEAVALNNENDVLVAAYKSPCTNCKIFQKVFQDLAEKFKERPNFVTAKIDVAENEVSHLARLRMAEKGPQYTICLFRKNETKMIPYEGPMTVNKLSIWLSKKLDTLAPELKTVEEAEKFISENEVVLIGFFWNKNSNETKTFISVSEEIVYPFAVTYSQELFKHYEAEVNTIMMFKKYDEPKTSMILDTMETSIKKFIDQDARPSVIELSEETQNMIFGGKIRKILLLMVSKKANDSGTNIEVLHSVAKDYRNELLFVVINVDLEENKPFLDHFQVKKKQIPTIRFIELATGLPTHEAVSTEINQKTVRESVEKFLKGELKRLYRSEELPKNWNKNTIKILVGSNFNEVAMNKDKDVFVNFCIPNEELCKDFDVIYRKLAEKYKKSNTVVLTQFNPEKNDLEGLQLTGLPTLKLYRKEDNKIIEYFGHHTVEAISKFIDSSGAEEKTETKDEL